MRSELDVSDFFRPAHTLSGSKLKRWVYEYSVLAQAVVKRNVWRDDVEFGSHTEGTWVSLIKSRSSEGRQA